MSGKKSEDSYGEKVDRCLYNALSKFVVGVGVGIVTAAVVRFKPWPIILGAGVGTGMGISDCNYEFKAGTLSSVVKQSLEGDLMCAPPVKKKAPPFVVKKKILSNDLELDEDEREAERRERLAGIIGRSSHHKNYNED